MNMQKMKGTAKMRDLELRHKEELFETVSAKFLQRDASRKESDEWFLDNLTVFVLWPFFNNE